MEYGALGGIVSGSGPTIAFLVADNEAALDLAVALTASGVASSVKRATGRSRAPTPDAGAAPVPLGPRRRDAQRPGAPAEAAVARAPADRPGGARRQPA